MDTKEIAKIGMHGHVVVEAYRNGKLLWREEGENLVTYEGINHTLDVLLHGTSQTATWRVGLIGTNSTPVDGWDYAGIGTDFTEFVNYDESVRQEYEEAASSSQSITNSANKAKFTIDTDSSTIYGAFLCDNSTKADNSSGTVLLCAKLFSSSKALDDDDELYITYTVSGSST